MTVTEERPHLSKADIRGFDRATQGLLMEIVNDHGVKYRMANGHCLLYPPDGESRPFKVSPKRAESVNRQILEVQFMERFGLREPEATESPLPASEEPTGTDPQPEAEEPGGAEDGSEVAENEGAEDAMRSAIGILQAALGVEDEALEALMELDSLRARLAKATDEVEKKIDEARVLRRDLAAEQRETERLRTKSERLENVLDEVVAERDKAKTRLKMFRDALKEED